jgi:O-antigen biosynthesis protein
VTSVSSENWADDHLLSVSRGPATPPPVARDTRRELAAEFFRGSGIEIGALHLPMAMPADVRVRYVDRMTVPELRKHYPELDGHDLAPVDVVDDGETLSTIEPESVDFIVANHFLEHCEDPIRTITTHLDKLRPGGVLFYAVPDKRYTFDCRRPQTPLGHLIADHQDGGQGSRHEHYLEWVRLVYPEGNQPPDEPTARLLADDLNARGYSIHFHVWTQADLLELTLHCHQQLASFEIEAVRRAGIENIVVLRKHGDQVIQESPAAATTVPKRWRRLAAGRIKIPLSALRVALDDESAQALWSVDPDGVSGRALVQSAASVVTIPLRLGGAVGFSARVRLLPHDWRDGTGMLRAWVAVTDPSGTQRTLWSGWLPTAVFRQGKSSGLPVSCEVPASSASLHLGIGPRSSGTGQLVERAAWVGPEIADPAGAQAPGLGPSPGSVPAPDGLASSDKPLISVLTPVHNPPLHMLEEAIASVRSQTFAAWELCLADDGSTNPEVIAALERHAASDPRIHLNRRETAGGISTATNAALKLATGEYIALLDHDDTLAPDAFRRVAEQIAAQSDIDMIYSDEAIVMDGRPIWLHLKPEWSPDTERTNGYTCHLGVYRRALVAEIGGFRSEFDGSQDMDMILRLVERTDRIAHIPRILYHWRVHASSTAGGDAKPYAYVAARNAIAGHLERSGIEADVGYGPPGLYRVVHRIDRQQSIALVLAAQDSNGLAEAARSWVSQPHPAWNVVLAAPEQAFAGCADALQSAGVEDSRVTMVPIKAGTDAPTALVAAADAATSELLLIMQAPAVGLTHDWLTRLIGYGNQAEIAAAGPMVLGPDGRISEAGVALPQGIPLYLLHGSRSSMDKFFGYGTSVFNVSAVSGALATRRDTYQRLGGLDLRLLELALIDYCLRATETGGRVVIVPDARLRVIGPDTTVNDLGTIWRLRDRWAQTHTHDPYYNPNFRTDRGDFEPIRH